MKNGVFKRVLSTALAGFLAITSTSFVAKDLTTNAAKVLQTSPGHTQETGTYNGYHHEIWQADTPNSSTMTLADNGGGFSTSWKCGPNGSRGNFLARRGLFYGLNNPKHWQDYGGFSCDFDCEWSAGSSGNSRICIYGWTQNPLVEFYIIEDWKNWRPTSNNAKQVTIDGSVYDVFTNPMNSYTIEGNKAFTQYISVRRNTRTKGTISVSEHFKAWESLGMKMGGLYEVAFNVEGWESDGQANVKTNTMKTGKIDPIPDPVPEKLPEPDANGDYKSEGFDSGKGDFSGRGDATVSVDNKNYYDGQGSLKITDRGDYWHGGSISLSSSDFIPGQTYSISAAALQKSGAATDLKLTLEYTGDSGQDWMEIASAEAKSGEWTKLENTKFTVPSGASEMSIYLEAPDSLTDLWLDSFKISKEGKSSSVTTGSGTVDGSGSVAPTTTANGQTFPIVTTTKTPGTSNGNWNKQNAGLKNVFSKYYRVGTAVSANEVGKNPDFIIKHFNSITPENELKPDQILDQSASKASGNNVNPQVKLGWGATAILDFAARNNIPVRGHTLVWHSQTPTWLFKENFDDNGAMVSKDIMNQRIDNYIKNVFTTLKKEYPTVQFYAYDVANECFADGQPGGLRKAGWNWQGGESPWNLVYGDDSYLEVAFTAARKYAPEGCQLYYNDYNEYEDPKMSNIYNLVSKLYKKGILDGVGMQSHLDTNYPSASQYQKALDKYSSIGCAIEVTELDVTCTNESTQGAYYGDIVKAIKNCDKVNSLTFWGTNDGMSWRGEKNPLPFDRSYNGKAAYNSIISLVNESEYGDGYAAGGINQQPQTTAPQTTASVVTTTTTPAPTPSNISYGDVNLDKDITIADAVAILQFLGNKDKYKLSDESKANGDVFNTGDGLTANDALTIQKYDAGLVTKLPVSVMQGYVTGEKKNNPVTTTVATNAPVITTTAAPKAESFINDTFESGAGKWSARGDSVSIDSESGSYYSGSKCVKVSGRTEGWNGISYTLGSEFKAGNSYSFSAAVMQASGSTEEVRLSLQFTDSTGKTDYAHIATADAADKTWTKLENTSYTIPAGATDLVLYVETAESTCDLYVDSISAGTEGIKADITTGGGKVGEIKAPTPKTDGSVDTSWIDPSKPMVAISFDDGTRDPSQEKRIIDALKKNGFHATFFYVGNWITSPETVQYAFQNGNEIANHTTTHPYLSKISSSEVRSEFDQTHAKLKSIIGTEPSKLMRLPYLDSNANVQKTLYDVPLISCAIDTKDWNGASKDQIVNTIKSNMSNGNLRNSIVLCHENYSTTASAMEEVLPYLKAQGWQVVTISEMFAVNGKSLNGGQVYTRC